MIESSADELLERAWLLPIEGRRVDPPPRSWTASLEKTRRELAHTPVLYRAFQRFSYARATLLAAGTAYYAFLSVFAMAALGYGLARWLGSPRVYHAITTALEKAFPGLVGSQGIDSVALGTTWKATSIVGLVFMLYVGSAAMYAASRSLHNIYGAPKDPRSYLSTRARLLAWLVLLAPLAAASYVISGSVTSFATEVFNALGVTGPLVQTLIVLGGVAAALALDFLIVYLLLGHFGGIMPERNARIVGAGLGAVCIELLKYGMGLIVAWSLSKTQYGALAVPITILLIIYLQCIVLFACAALTAALSPPALRASERDMNDDVRLEIPPEGCRDEATDPPGNSGTLLAQE